MLVLDWCVSRAAESSVAWLKNRREDDWKEKVYLDRSFPPKIWSTQPRVDSHESKYHNDVYSSNLTTYIITYIDTLNPNLFRTYIIGPSSLPIIILVTRIQADSTKHCCWLYVLHADSCLLALCKS